MADLSPKCHATMRLVSFGDRITAQCKEAGASAEVAIIEQEILRFTQDLKLDLYGVAALTSKLFAFGMRVVARVRDETTSAVVDEAQREVGRLSLADINELCRLKRQLS